MPLSSLISKFIIKSEAVVRLSEIEPTPGGGFDLSDVVLPTPDATTRSGHALRPPLYDRFIVVPETRVRLDEVDASDCDDYESREAALPETHSLLRKLDKLQYLIHAEKRHSLLIVFQGLDASGKDG